MKRVFQILLLVLGAAALLDLIQIAAALLRQHCGKCYITAEISE